MKKIKNLLKKALVFLPMLSLLVVGMAQANTSTAPKATNVAATHRTVTGTIKSIASDGNTFVVKVGNRNVAVINGSNLKVMNANGTSMNFSNLRVGDRVSVFGTVNKMTESGQTAIITASSIKDITQK